MINFGERLSDLMEENGLKYNDITKLFGLNYNSLIYKWLKNESVPRIDKIIVLADHFQCSIDYLLCRTDDYQKVAKRKLPQFNNHLREILNEKHITQYKLIKDTKFDKGHLYAWLTKNEYPSTENIVLLADYLGVSVDYLVGRV